MPAVTLLAAFLIASEAPVRVQLQWLSLEKARALNGKMVRASFGVGKPPDSSNGFTVIGCDDQPDGIERGAVLRGEDLDVEEGDWKTVVGRLRVIDHTARVVNGVRVEA
ncbi:MAG TPA: hypothetical protein VKE74_11400 [Gemmataceae bacterium]|nr:hypothetical protein [Gemmataceae bacterium]